jgi:hypothetical protein
MLIVDAQIHLWNAGNPTSTTHRQVPAYLKDHALNEIPRPLSFTPVHASAGSR